MNKARRAAIAELQSQLETLRDEEQEAFDNLPESLQDGEKGQSMEEAIGLLDDAISSLEEISAR